MSFLSNDVSVALGGMSAHTSVFPQACSFGPAGRPQDNMTSEDFKICSKGQEAVVK